MYKHIKPEAIAENMFHNADMMREFVALYQTQTPIDFNKLLAAVENEDFKSISDAAHHIKPTMAYIGATHLKDALQEIELLAKENQDLSQIQAEVHVLTPQFEELYLELQQYYTHL